jgi:Polyketide cyclase / dehydrase and lipid transport
MTFTPLYVSRSGVIHLPAAPEQVFPLFEPLGEMRWAQGWAPHMLYPAAGEACIGMVFTTQHPGEAETTWTVAAYDPERCHITYVRQTPGSRVGVIDVACTSVEEHASRVTVSYIFTSLSEEGNAYIAAFTEDHYSAYMADWEHAINHYLRHGVLLQHHPDHVG